MAGSTSIPPVRRLQVVEPVPEAGCDPEVAAASPDRPEQVGFGLGVGADQRPIGGDDLGGEQRVDRQAVLADQEPDAAGRREPADADVGGVTEPGAQAVLGRRRRCRRRR